MKIRVQEVSRDQSRIFCPPALIAPKHCERGGPLQKCKTPNPPKVLGRVLGEVPARNGVLREVLRKVLVLLVSRRDTRDKHFSEHLPEHPGSGRHPSEHSPEHFWGNWGFCASVGGRPVRNQSTTKKSGFWGASSCREEEGLANPDHLLNPD